MLGNLLWFCSWFRFFFMYLKGIGGNLKGFMVSLSIALSFFFFWWFVLQVVWSVVIVGDLSWFWSWIRFLWWNRREYSNFVGVESLSEFWGFYALLVPWAIKFSLFLFWRFIEEIWRDGFQSNLFHLFLLNLKLTH